MSDKKQIKFVENHKTSNEINLQPFTEIYEGSIEFGVITEGGDKWYIVTVYNDGTLVRVGGIDDRSIGLQLDEQGRVKLAE